MDYSLLSMIKIPNPSTHSFIFSWVPSTITSSKYFKHINIHIVVPLVLCQGYIYLLIITDNSKSLICTWIPRFGIPERIASYEGRQFESFPCIGQVSKISNKYYYCLLPVEQWVDWETTSDFKNSFKVLPREIDILGRLLISCPT